MRKELKGEKQKREPKIDSLLKVAGAVPMTISG